MWSKKRIILILIIFLIILGIYVFSSYPNGKGSYHGKHNILVLCIDTDEQREGIGAVDMAFIITLNGGRLGDISPIYPGGLYDPTLSPPDDLISQGVNKWYLHDSLWTSSLDDGVARAKKIIKYNTNITSDIAVVVTPDAIDAMIGTVGPVYSNDKEITSESLAFLRSEERDNGAKRGDAIEGLASGIVDSTKQNHKEANLLATIIDQKAKGNIRMLPENAFGKLVSYVGISSVF